MHLLLTEIISMCYHTWLLFLLLLSFSFSLQKYPIDIQENLVYQLVIRPGTSPDIKTEQGNALGEKSKGKRNLRIWEVIGLLNLSTVTESCVRDSIMRPVWMSPVVWAKTMGGWPLKL